MDMANLTRQLAGCACGKEHTASFRTVAVASGVTGQTGSLLSEALFLKRLLVVYDKNTLAASPGLIDSLSEAGFSILHTDFEDLQIADEFGANRVLEDVKRHGAEGILSVGTGSLNDICRYAAAKSNLPFAILATAPSMDGFASSMAPITINGFKRTFPAKTPEVILADTAVLAKSPCELKAAGLGDLLGKYTAHADWVIASLLTGEYYCETVAGLTRDAVDRAVALASRGDTESEDYAAGLMEALILSGLAMQLCGCTRPASGAEHHLAHFWEMKFQLAGRKQLFHGKKVGIATGMLADVYNDLADVPDVTEVQRELDENELSAVFGSLWPEARKESFPNPLEEIPFGRVEEKWPEIKAALAKVPSGKTVRKLLTEAGGEATCAQAGIGVDLARQGIRYGRYARFRITMMRVLDRLTFIPDYEKYVAEQGK
jgi:glycerol-1-phosphate dehydrogenase [NAD(P)+]